MTIREANPVRNYCIKAGVVLIVAIALMTCITKSHAECNCSGKDSAAGAGGGGSRYGGGGVSKAEWEHMLASSWGVPQLNAQEKAKWNTVGSFLYNQQGYNATIGLVGGWFGWTNAYSGYNTWGARVSDSGHVGAGFGGWSH